MIYINIEKNKLKLKITFLLRSLYDKYYGRKNNLTNCLLLTFSEFEDAADILVRDMFDNFEIENTFSLYFYEFHKKLIFSGKL